jgi:tripartite-type tricarboxylate transporter receptor subunit TctC
MNPTRRRVLTGLGAGALGIAAGAQRATAADFYQGKTLTMIVGFAPGGGVDSISRLIARHLVRFIPGQPGIVVQNMEGAGGFIAATHLYQRVAPDGLTISTPGRSWFVEGVVKNPGANFDPAKFGWIGSPGAVNSMIFIRGAAGVKTFADLKASPRPIAFGSLGATTTTSLLPVMLANNGYPIKVVTGYGATARILLAIEQGEVDAVFTVEESFARRQDLIQKKIVIPIARSLPGEPALPLVRDALPKSDGPVLNLVLAIDSFGLPVVAPPGVPADRLDILRTAFLAMSADKDYQADAMKIDQPIGSPLSGDKLAALIKELEAGATPETVAAYRRIGAAK